MNLDCWPKILALPLSLPLVVSVWTPTHRGHGAGCSYRSLHPGFRRAKRLLPPPSKGPGDGAVRDGADDDGGGGEGGDDGGDGGGVS